MSPRLKLTKEDIAAALKWAGREYALLLPADVDPGAVLGRQTVAGMGRLGIDVRRALKGLQAVQGHEHSRVLKRAIASKMAIHSLPQVTSAGDMFDRFDRLVREMEHLAAACEELSRVSKLKLGTGLSLLIRALVVALHERTGRWPTLTDVRACLDFAALHGASFHPHFTRAQGEESAVKVAFDLVRAEVRATGK